MTVTYQVGGGGNLDIDFWASVLLPHCRINLMKRVVGGSE